MGLDIFTNEGTSEKGCVEIEDWGFSVHFGLGFQENPIYSLHLRFSEDITKWCKVYSLMGCFWPKYIMFELKKYRRDTFHDTRVWCKIWRKTDLWFGKWHEEFGKFSPEHTKLSKSGLIHWILLYKVEIVWT